MKRIRVAVLMGGTSAEREVSLSSGRQVLAALDPARYEAFPVDTAILSGLPGPLSFEPAPPGMPPRPQADWSGLPSPGDPPFTGANRPDVAFLCLHGKYGEDGTIQGMLELLGIPYTGSGVLASALAMDKVMSKKLLALEGIPTPPAGVVRNRAEGEAYLEALRRGEAPVGCPAVVKPSRQGSTIGISVVREPEQMAAALQTALAFDEDVLVERCVEGVEITASVLGNDDLECLPLVEIVPGSGFYDYEAKYTPGATEEIVPARIPAEASAAARELAIRSHRALGCRGVSRTDMIVGADGIWVLEVNTIPGMTPTSLLPRAAAAAGMEFPALVERMIALALEERTLEPVLS